MSHRKLYTLLRRPEMTRYFSKVARFELLTLWGVLDVRANRAVQFCISQNFSVWRLRFCVRS
jgi:hypothetical protein